MTQRRTNGNRYRFPIMIMQGFLPIRWSGIPLEIIVGVTLAALAIPEVMGYTKIAGTPVITGLYTMLIPVGLFAIFGSSRHLVVGADSATAAMLAAGLAGLAAAGSPEYIALAGVLALLAAGFLLLARVFQLGFLANFLSRTILVGFLTGVGIQVSIGQISGMLGLHVGGSGPVSQLLNDWQQIGRTQLYALAISLVVLAVIIGSKRISMRISWPADCSYRRHRDELGFRSGVEGSLHRWSDSKRDAINRGSCCHLERGTSTKAPPDRFRHIHRDPCTERCHISGLCRSL